MDDILISVIMSTYNESEKELKASIYSVLKQTHSNIEFIIVNDNPENKALHNILFSIEDTRIHILNNTKNFGLVYSLNRAWNYANGNIIARMDADDICVPTRLEKQLDIMQRGDYDLLGCNIKMIGELEDIIYFPTTTKEIKRKISWFNCIAHPTWMIKKNIYEELGGYRNIAYCEDYDFILRTIELGYKVGNMPEVGLMYRIRNNSISNKNSIDQYLLSRYLSSKRKKILRLNEKDIREYHISQKFKKKRKKYISYSENKQMIKNNDFKLKNIFDILLSPYLYINVLEIIARKK